MNLFSRLSELLALDLDGLWQDDDLETVLAKVDRETEEDLACAKRYAATVLAVERHLARDLEHCRVQAEFWHRKARESLSAGRESLARRALVRKKEQDEAVRRLETEYAAALQSSETAKRSLHSLEALAAEARRQQRSVLARYRAAMARSSLRAKAAAGKADTGTVKARLKHLLAELRELGEELMIQAEVSEDRDANRQDVEEELETLKEELRAE